MSKDEIIAEILRLPPDQQRNIIEQVINQLPDSAHDPDMTPELRAELDRRSQDMLDHPENKLSLEQARAYLDQRRAAHENVAS